MNANDAAREINRLHGEVERLADESKTALTSALGAAWRAGRLLLAEKKRVRRTMGGGAWQLWLKEHFRGSERTAQRYMRLAASVDNVTALQAMSLRQAYAGLGIPTEPKSVAATTPVQALPAHVRLANRLLVALKPCAQSLTPQQRETYRQDLRALYEQLRRLFERERAANFAA